MYATLSAAVMGGWQEELGLQRMIGPLEGELASVHAYQTNESRGKKISPEKLTATHCLHFHSGFTDSVT